MFWSNLYIAWVREHNLLTDECSQQSIVQPSNSTSHTSTGPLLVWKKIEDNISVISNFTIEMQCNILVTKRILMDLKKEDWKSLNSGGYKLFREGYVQKIHVC